MRFSIQRMRVWLLVAAALLVCVIVAFLGYAQYRLHQLVRDLPRRLGVDIQQETNGFTYSQAIKGRTAFTIHASKMVQMKASGKVMLHDVGIVVNGKDGAPADHIYGKEFEYDAKNQVMTARGEVQMDLRASGSGDAKADGNGSKSGVVHVRTSGLTFLEKMGVAATGDDIEFEVSGATGRAHGAEYDSDSGLLVLESAVKVNALTGGRPVVVTASHAELVRDANQAVLTDAAYVSPGADGDGQSGSAGQATAHLRKDGTLDWVEAAGNVTLRNQRGGEVMAPHAVAAMNAHGEPQRVDMTGGVRYSYAADATGNNRGERSQGTSAEAHARFGANAALQQLQLVGDVRMKEEVGEAQGAVGPASGEPQSVERELEAADVTVAFAADAKGHSLARTVKALGGAAGIGQGQARLRVTTRVLASSGGARKGQAFTGGARLPTAGLALGQVRTQTTRINGDELDAELTQAGGTIRFSRVTGIGKTGLTQEAADGSVETSTGDRLEVRLAASPQGSGGAMGVDSATQSGHVRITQTAATVGARPTMGASSRNADTSQTTTAQAALAEYRGATGELLLTGSPQVVNGGMTLWATRMTLERDSGDATAMGDVKGTLVRAAEVGSGSPGVGNAQPSAGKPMHIAADHAQLRHVEQKAIFYGGARNARLWQGASEVDAPVIEFSQAVRTLTLTARGAKPVGAALLATAGAGDTGAVVHAVFLSAGQHVGSKDASASKSGQGVVRVASRALVYSEAKHEADFAGSVRVDDGDARMMSDSAVVTLQSGADGGSAAAGAAGPLKGIPPTGAAGGDLFGGSVEKVVGTGGVVLEEQGRRASGERLVYTAADGAFVLTGTAAAPPRLVDKANGTVTGGTLSFHSGDEKVVVSGDGPQGRQRTRTETTVQEKHR